MPDRARNQEERAKLYSVYLRPWVLEHDDASAAVPHITELNLVPASYLCVRTGWSTTDGKIDRIFAPRRAGDPAALVSDPGRLKATLPWKPRHANLEEIIVHALAWERKLATIREMPADPDNRG